MRFSQQHTYPASRKNSALRVSFDIKRVFRAKKQHFHLNGIGIKENVAPLCKQIIEAMIRSIPNPPMDVARFRRNLEKRLRGDFSAEERHRIEERKARTEPTPNE